MKKARKVAALERCWQGRKSIPLMLRAVTLIIATILLIGAVWLGVSGL
jgi:hypothetical protein